VTASTLLHSLCASDIEDAGVFHGLSLKCALELDSVRLLCDNHPGHLEASQSMPTFSFKCKKCGKVFDVFLMGRGKKVRCPECGSGRLERVFKPFRVKGGKSSSCSSCSTSGSAGVG